MIRGRRTGKKRALAWQRAASSFSSPEGASAFIGQDSFREFPIFYAVFAFAGKGADHKKRPGKTLDRMKLIIAYAEPSAGQCPAEGASFHGKGRDALQQGDGK